MKYPNDEKNLDTPHTKHLVTETEELKYIDRDQFSLALKSAGEVLNYVKGTGEISGDVYEYVRSLPFSKTISYKVNIYNIEGNHNTYIAREAESILKLIDNTKDRAFGYQSFMKDIINKIPNDIDASSILPILLYRVKTGNNIESIRIAAEFVCKISGFLTNDWLVESAIYIAQKEIPSTLVMENLANSMTCLFYNAKDANEVIGVYLDNVKRYKTSAGKISTIKVTEDFVSKINIKTSIQYKAISVMESYIGDKDVKFQSVKVILDIFQIKESLGPNNKEWPVRVANAVRFANHKYNFLDSHPFLEKIRDGDQKLPDKPAENVSYVNESYYCLEGYDDFNNEVDIYIVNNLDEY